MGRETNKSLSVKQRFPLEAVLGSNPSCLLAQIRSELPMKAPSNGSAVRIKTLKVLCELLELQNRKLDSLHDLFLRVIETGGASK